MTETMIDPRTNKESIFVTRVSILTGNTTTMLLPISEERYNAWLQSKTTVQRAFPDLTDNQREFLISGITAEEWESLDMDNP
jgi:hypothetical protein